MTQKVKNKLSDDILKNLIKKNLEKLKKEFKIQSRVNYKVKLKKLELLKEIFNPSDVKNIRSFRDFEEKNNFWLKDYCLFKVLKEKYNEASWESWDKDADQIPSDSLSFHSWLQWQLFLQLKDVKKYAQKNDVFLMGDLPFLVSRDSAEVWTHQNYFKLDLASGAPPDGFNDKGQRWGMPPYNWAEIKKDNFSYLVNKLQYAENFYDMYRIDHFIGLFRVWTIPLDEDIENHGLNGTFDPSDETLWEEHGKDIINKMLESANMLPCAEDLGVIPECSFKLLDKYCIPGIDIQRWSKDKSGHFKNENTYRKNSIAAISTHDTSSFYTWWLYEAEEKEKKYFLEHLGNKDQDTISFDLIKTTLEKINNSTSIFSIQMFQDWLSLSMNPVFSKEDFRINIPATISTNNWNIVMPFSLEEMNSLPINQVIKEINSASGRH